MRKIILMGRSETGKTTLRQALNGGALSYQKTQYIGHENVVIDTPGEYAETSDLARALALYAYEADVVGLLLNATEPYSLYPPCCTVTCNRPVIGIITKIDSPDANVPRVTRWLKLAGCTEIFPVSAYTGEGIWEILEYLAEPGDVLPFENEAEANRPRMVLSDKWGEVDQTGTSGRRSWSQMHGHFEKAREARLRMYREADPHDPALG